MKSATDNRNDWHRWYFQSHAPSRLQSCAYEELMSPMVWRSCISPGSLVRYERRRVPIDSLDLRWGVVLCNSLDSTRDVDSVRIGSASVGFIALLHRLRPNTEKARSWVQTLGNLRVDNKQVTDWLRNGRWPKSAISSRVPQSTSWDGKRTSISWASFLRG